MDERLDYSLLTDELHRLGFDRCGVATQGGKVLTETYFNRVGLKVKIDFTYLDRP